jgi:hypothetical protein
LRKYFETMMSEATCDQSAGTSASAISKTTVPSGFVMRDVRVDHATPAKASSFCEVNRRSTFNPVLLPRPVAFIVCPRH